MIDENYFVHFDFWRVALVFFVTLLKSVAHFALFYIAYMWIAMLQCKLRTFNFV